ncbi:hypothetical protein G3I44_06455 [Halogeometricum borinquense]|uniref:DUF8027 domain-containing protein n=1 Tax=Halogeometricum borinquense TaxID=60847 RepID=A0A6C0UHB0_9EURY|nr:hypothetical protein [Halogeometricum borinquense]QIB73963.1 hypothetical protein G3I44_06455 [Halogeometricum borinquense]
MPVSGYDPDDVESQLRAALLAGELEPYLTVAAIERHERGKRLDEMLSAEEIAKVVGSADSDD